MKDSQHSQNKRNSRAESIPQPASTSQTERIPQKERISPSQTISKPTTTVQATVGSQSDVLNQEPVLDLYLSELSLPTSSKFSESLSKDFVRKYTNNLKMGLDNLIAQVESSVRLECKNAEFKRAQEKEMEHEDKINALTTKFKKYEVAHKDWQLAQIEHLKQQCCKGCRSKFNDPK